ncbi:MAG: KilA-N domain-containing protein [Clostridia bacterium]
MKNKVSIVINVQENKIGILRVNNIDYISLTDLAKYQNPEDPSFVIKDWVRRIKTIEYIGLWEKLNNPGFNLGELHQIKNEKSKYK